MGLEEETAFVCPSSHMIKDEEGEELEDEENDEERTRKIPTRKHSVFIYRHAFFKGGPYIQACLL